MSSEHEDPLSRHRERCESFRFDVPERFNFGRDVVDRHAETDGPALWWKGADGRDRHLRFSDVRDASARIAAALSARGVAPGDPVIVMLPKIPEWHLAMVGALKCGALVIPCSTILRPKDLVYRVGHSGAVAIVTTPALRSMVDEVREELASVRDTWLVDEAAAEAPPGWTLLHRAMAEVDPGFVGPETHAGDPALVYYTSGTTGPPKAVLHTHAYTYTQRLTAEAWLGLGAGDRIWTTSDTGWAKAAYSVLFGPWSVAAEVCMYEGRFEPARELSLLAEFEPDVFCAPPTEYRLLVKEDLSGLSLPRVRECVSAGEPLNPEVIRAWKEATGITVRDGYGQTESILLVGNLPGIPVRPGSMGLAMPGHEVEIIDETGRVVPPGEPGDIAVGGAPASLFREYWKDPEATVRCRRPRPDRPEAPWYVTGDRASRDEDGYFWFLARADDVIISAGYRIGPFEVESALLEHPDVVEAAAVGVPDPDRGHVVKAFVVLRAGTRGDDALARRLQEHVKQVTAPYKYPRQIEFVETLPKTVSGKIRRVELRRESAEGDASSS
jgi:acetyl-CoA synthetase/medium-chain acyl-CoA synthetase